MGHVAGTKRFKDAMKLRVYGCATCPCNRIKSSANQRQRPKYLAKPEFQKQTHTRVGIKTSINKKNTVEFKCKKHQLILITKEENELGIKMDAH